MQQDIPPRLNTVEESSSEWIDEIGPVVSHCVAYWDAGRNASPESHIPRVSIPFVSTDDAETAAKFLKSVASNYAPDCRVELNGPTVLLRSSLEKKPLHDIAAALNDRTHYDAFIGKLTSLSSKGRLPRINFDTLPRPSTDETVLLLLEDIQSVSKMFLEGKSDDAHFVVTYPCTDSASAKIQSRVLRTINNSTDEKKLNIRTEGSNIRLESLSKEPVKDIIRDWYAQGRNDESKLHEWTADLGKQAQKQLSRIFCLEQPQHRNCR